VLVIPVMDLLDGVVVAARGGARETYRPIVTPLAASADPVDVARGLLNVHPFPRLYVADLDGIAGRAGNVATLRRLRRAFPDIELMIDDGSATSARVEALFAIGGAITPVIGTETLPDIGAWTALQARFGDRLALSLDFHGGAYRGPPELDAKPALWPATVIAMTLAAVGRDRGPDLACVQRLAARAPGHSIIAAGGVRHMADVRALTAAGAAGVLVASALHAKKIGPGDLA
jgi:phosphoribosylformimino-5-aminoimidazole carboxamide ribotide isomerase